MRISQTIPRFMFQPGPPGCASARLDARPGSGLEERGNKGMGERGGRKEGMLWRREREREGESPLSNGFTRWVRWWNSPLKWFYWRAWGATTSRREGSKVWPTHPRPEERKEGCLSPQPPSSLNLAMFLRGNLENWAKGFRPYPPFAFVLSIPRFWGWQGEFREWRKGSILGAKGNRI